MLIKLLGCVLIICATSGFGYSKGLEYKRHIEELEKLKRVIWHLKGEMSYTRASLQDICRKVAKRVETPYANWLLSMAEIIERKGFTGLGTLWEVETMEQLQGLSLTAKELKELASLGHQMGYLDVSRQEETLKWYGEQLEERRNTLAEKAGEKCRLCNCLGVMSGIFITILLL